MRERKGVLKMYNDNYMRQRNTVAKPKQKSTMPFLMSEPIMPKEVEKEIILDAIGSFIISCDAKEANDFIKAITNTLITACVMVFSEQNELNG
jgi:hypothetical protein